MFPTLRRLLCLLSLLAFAFAFEPSAVAGKGNGKGNGGGGGGGGGDGAAAYTVIDLGPGQANAVNDFGEAVGASNDLAIYWHVDANDNVSQQPLPDFNLFHSFANDLNHAGQAVGFVGNGVADPSRAVLWQAIGTPAVSVEYLGDPQVPAGVVVHTNARAVNASGIVVGTIQYRDGEGNLLSKVAGVWLPNGVDHDVFELPESLHGSAYDINDDGEIVGKVMGQPVLWRLQFDNDGLLSGIAGPNILPSLGGPWGSAVGINNDGTVVGSSDVSEEETHAVRWQLDESGNATETTDLGLLPRMDWASGSRLNDAGVIIGSSRTYINLQSWKSRNDGFLYQNGSMQSLTDLLSGGPFDKVLTGIGINELNWLCGRGDVNSVSHAFIAIPNP